MVRWCKERFRIWEVRSACENDTEAERQRRVAGLTLDERKAFEWFKAGYTPRWTEETMLLDKKTARRLFAGIYRKLGVHGAPEISRLYGKRPLCPEDMPNEENL